jgi:hypothetical protein
MFWIAFLASQAGSGIVASRDPLDPAYSNIEIESACGDHVVRMRFRNVAIGAPRGRVVSVSIDNEEVRGAATQLQARVADRFIDRMGIMNCGPDARNPIVTGNMVFSDMESQREGLPPRIFFRLRRDNGVWNMILE